MAKIVYGVSGEGSGHASRAREMIGDLEQAGHTVKVVSYDRGYRDLKDDFDVFAGEGLHIVSNDNRVSAFKTLVANFKKLPEGRKIIGSLQRSVFQEYCPDCVITDFEPMTAYLANQAQLPLISIDNQHAMRYMTYPKPPHLKKARLISEQIIRGMVPKPDVALVTTFYFGEPKNDHTFLFPPILRQEVLKRHSQPGSRILVYLTSGFDSLLELLQDFLREHFMVYGYNRSERIGNLEFKPAGRESFLDDLSSCKAVIATAGFTLMSEALYFKKPYLALPMRNQFEQELNGYLLAKLGYGANLRHPNRATIGSFLYHLPEFQDKLKTYRAEDNRAIRDKLTSLLAEKGARLKALTKQRRMQQ